MLFVHLQLHSKTKLNRVSIIQPDDSNCHKKKKSAFVVYVFQSILGGKGDVGQNTRCSRIFLQQRAKGFCKYFVIFFCFINHLAARFRFGCAAMCVCVLNLNNYWNIIFTWNISHGLFSVLFLFCLACFSLFCLFTLIDVVFLYVCTLLTGRRTGLNVCG